jgi:hypothetical protein
MMLVPSIFRHDETPSRRSSGRELAHYLPQRRLVRPGVVKNDVSYTAAWRISADDPALKDQEAIKNVTWGTAAAIGLLQRWPGTFVQFYIDRFHVREYDRGLSVADQTVLQLMDELQADQFLEGDPLFGTECFAALTWTPPSKMRDRFRAMLAEGVESALRTESGMIEEFEGIFRQFQAQLEVAMSVERLTGDAVFSDILRFYNRFGPTGKDVPFRVPSPYVPLHEAMACDYRAGMQVRVGSHEVGCIDIATPPAVIEPLVLQPLAQLAVPHTLVVRVAGMSLGEAQSVTDTAIIDHKGAAEFNRAQIASPEHLRAIRQFTEARGNVGDEFRRLGKTTTTIVVRAKARETVEDRQEAIVAALSGRGYVAEVPKVEAFDTFVSTFPAQRKYGMRTFPIDALETATALPIFAARRGERFSSSASFPKSIHVPCVAYAVNQAREPYRFHLNPMGSDLRHGLICGQTTSGKSVLVNYLAAMERGRQPCSAISLIDRGLSARPSCMMLDGSFWDVFGDYNAPGFSLFCDADVPEIQGDLTDMIEGWVTLQGVEVTPDRRKALLGAVRLMGSMDRAARSYSAFEAIVHAQYDGHILEPAVAQYGPGGILGSLFNNTEDRFSVSRFNVVDTTRLRAKGEKFVIPVLNVIFWKIDQGEKALKRMLPDLNSVIIVDEMQELTSHPLGAKWAKLQHTEARKSNRALWLVGPSIKSFVDMADRDALLKASETRLYAPDTGATSELGHVMYEAMQLPKNGREMLTRMRRHRWLLHRPGDETLAELDFSLGEGVRGVAGDSRANAVIDYFLEKYPIEKYGNQRWKVERLIADPAPQVQAAGRRLQAIIELRERVA